MILDTHKFVEELVGAGFKKNQAEVFVNRLNESSDNLSTKADIDALRKDTKADIQSLRKDTKADIVEAKYDILKFVIPMQFTILLCIIGLWFKI